MLKLLATLLVSSLLIIACNDESATKTKTADELMLDSLNKDVDDGHIAGMSKMGKLNRLQQRVKVMIDSIDQLPAQAKTKLADYRQKLDTTLKQLDYADFAMNKWMSEFKMDSAVNNTKARIRYLADEKIKVDNMKDAILNSIRRADSLFGSK